MLRSCMNTSGEASRETTYELIRIRVNNEFGRDMCCYEEQCTSKQIQHLQSPESAQARPVVEFHCDTRQRACNRKPNEIRVKRRKPFSSASRADLCADVKRGHVVSHRSIGFIASMFFSIVCTVTVTRMRKGSEKWCRRA